MFKALAHIFLFILRTWVCIQGKQCFLRCLLCSERQLWEHMRGLMSQQHTTSKPLPVHNSQTLLYSFAWLWLIFRSQAGVLQPFKGTSNTLSTCSALPEPPSCPVAPTCRSRSIPVCSMRWGVSPLFYSLSLFIMNKNHFPLKTTKLTNQNSTKRWVLSSPQWGCLRPSAYLECVQMHPHSDRTRSTHRTCSAAGLQTLPPGTQWMLLFTSVALSPVTLHGC